MSCTEKVGNQKLLREKERGRLKCKWWKEGMEEGGVEIGGGRGKKEEKWRGERHHSWLETKPKKSPT